MLFIFVYIIMEIKKLFNTFSAYHFLYTLYAIKTMFLRDCVI